MNVADIGAWAWALAGGMATVALGALAYALWVLAGLIQGLRASLLPEAHQVVREAHLLLEEGRKHVGLVAEATGRAEALMAAAEPTVERLAAAAETGSQAAGAVSNGFSAAKGWASVAAAATAAAWKRYRAGKDAAPAGVPVLPVKAHVPTPPVVPTASEGPPTPVAPPVPVGAVWSAEGDGERP